ncbi:MAG: DUF58 domain-containing protein [Bacteroidetes bacterium]|mgnify:CR=1 FL=1|nr:DUF58 domain-containing protein [Bacteroidota bacterium]MBT6687675.1 DUF58 domain-containing protein [Bacteroidota bacterium]MBT7142495.1 DUF58 domain-containing protein [Bacteroidota bacterium]MBT7493347.1 DUF58 domain-containing protein [Bacteroidota bacterium]
METNELIKKVRKIEIKTRRLSKHLFAGEYHSAFKGKGMTFSEVREYQYGDSIRTIDWNVTARFAHPYVKIYEEERELTVILLIDVSGSKEFGSIQQFKQEIITEIAAVLSFSAIHNNDKIGVIFFSNKIEKFIPPQKGRTHILRIIRELIDFKPENRETDIAEALRYFTNAIKKRCTAFVISDFIDSKFENALKIANKKHDVIALKVYDKREQELPSIGFVRLKDAETGKLLWVDTSSKKTRNIYKEYWDSTDKNLKYIFSKSGVDNVSISTDQDYVKPLMGLFKKR